ncbi:MAG: tRNA lysidine(34) synthetase TilS [Bacillota bacterium]|nr:tRNA lysidine(34) synthetase TilS [Bacillota bacterium]
MSDTGLLERRLLTAAGQVIEKAGLEPSCPLLVAVSGGSDSVALLLLLTRLKLPNPLHVVHVNHGLRGAESDADRDYVVRLAERLELPCHVFLLDDRLVRRDGSFSENAAREARWAHFLALQKQLAGSWLVLGQQREDQAETMLLHLFRGAALQGLGGMRAIDAGRRILRPLLALGRGDLRSWLTDLGVAWREDSSNLEALQLRNSLRLRLAPVLDSLFDPGWPRRLATSASLLHEDEELLQREAAVAALACLRLHSRDGRRTAGLRGLPEAILATLELKAYRRTAPALRRRILVHLLAWLAGDARDLNAAMLLGLDAHLAAGASPCPALPGDLLLHRSGGGCHLWSDSVLAAWSGVFTCAGGRRIAVCSRELEEAWRSGAPEARDELGQLVADWSIGYTSVPRNAQDAAPGICFLRGRAPHSDRQRPSCRADRERERRLLQSLHIPAALRSRVVWLEWADGRRGIAGLPPEAGAPPTKGAGGWSHDETW